MTASSGNHVSKLLCPRIFLFGDSLTQYAFSENGCWGSVLATNLERKCDIVVRGFSGYNTRMCKYVLPRVFDKEDVVSTAAFVLWLGANDCASAQDLGRQHVPLNEYVENLSEMLQYLKTCCLSEEKVILMTPPPFDGKKWMEKCIATGKPMPCRDNGLVAQYARAITSLGSQQNISVVDLYGEMLKEEDWKDMLVDGLHLTRTGSQKVASLLMPSLSKLTCNLPTLLPEWKEVNRENPEKSLAHWNTYTA